MVRSQNLFLRSLSIATVLTLGYASIANAAFTINLTFNGTYTAAETAAFNNAKATWESLIPGYQPGITLTTLNISATVAPIDGSGGILGQAGWTNGVYQQANSGVVYALATDGQMTFDSADLGDLEASGALNAVILHEMAHVMGFGSLWTYNGVYTNGTGQYTGANALNAYRMEFSQASATYVPVELDGGAGTANSHWDELTNVFDPQGRTLSQELMTGYLDTNNPYISRTTIESFRDIGFAPVAIVVPEASTVGLMMFGMTGVGIVQLRRRKKK